ncbi:MAG: glycoside hydrolase family 3 N-terminal domain-containing protein [Acidimicrobiales bacterium]
MLLVAALAVVAVAPTTTRPGRVVIGSTTTVPLAVEAAITAPAVEAQPSCVPASLDERAGRVLIVGLPETTSPEDPLVAEVSEIGVGGVLLTHANVESAEQVQDLVSSLRTAVRDDLLVSVDEEPGRVRTFEDLIGFVPSARRLAAENPVEAVEETARATGQVLTYLDVDMNLAPVADLDAGPWDGIIGDRSFSPDPGTAAQYVLAYARGLRDAGVTPVVKHFPGHGRTAGDDHVSAPEIDASLDVLMATDVHPFRDAVVAGAPVVMMGNVSYDALEADVPASLSEPAYRLLRDLGFRGAAITDSIGMAAVNLRWNYGDATVKALGAGADGVLGTDGWSARWMRDAVVDAVRSGDLPESRLNEAAARMTALAGGDPQQVACVAASLPVLR